MVPFTAAAGWSWRTRAAIILEQPQIRKALAGRGEAAKGEVQLAAVQALGEVERAARAQVQAYARRLGRDRGCDRSDEDQGGAIVHRDREAALRPCRLECGSTIERRVQAFQRGADGTGQPLGVGCGLHAVGGAHEQLVP
jgi:hypothetical protein